jgi:hypothetical protein
VGRIASGGADLLLRQSLPYRVAGCGRVSGWKPSGSAQRGCSR